ncbi:unnamed protein product [Adineta steineri]|uniref:Akirin n=1 Tax=Adineta steineri TaxID=433720 RepID=A0A814PKW2_9BILA|nr:unnamed protein product [Adineta steineri]CAF1376280.1 unnamed protein product [Adineta steineri]CAF1378231.1 unnamed protein product [Adineta steineri]
MASCMALKRSFEHDRDSSNNNPFESRTAASPSSSKRQRRCFPMTVVSSPTTTMTNETTESTVFPDVQPILTTDVLLTRIKEEVRRLQRRHQMKISTSSELSDDDNNTNLNECRSTTTNSQHLLTLKQVNIICARLLKEREEKLREEYDRILSNKLSEQYEGFVRFTQDQLTRRFSELQFSYVS